MPTGTRQVCNLSQQRTQVEGGQRQFKVARPVELPHAPHGARDIVYCPSDDFEIFARLRVQRPITFQKRLRVQGCRRERVVDVMRDPARHLAKRSQTLLLEDHLLGLAQVIISLLQGRMQLRLAHREGEMAAELAQKLAVRAGETVRFVARGQDYPEQLAVQCQRTHDERAQTAPRQPDWKCVSRLRRVRLVYQLPAGAAEQAVFVDGNTAALRESQLREQPIALRTDTRDFESLAGSIECADTAKVDREVPLEIADHDLKYAAQILMLADRTGGLIQQAETLDLGLQPLVGTFTFRDVPYKRAEGDLRSGADGSDRDLNRKFAAVAALCIELDSSVQHAGFARGEIAFQADLVRFPLRCRNHRLRQSPAEHLGCIPTEHHLGLLTPTRHGPFAVDGDHRVERRIDDQSSTLLAVPPGLLFATALMVHGLEADAVYPDEQAEYDDAAKCEERERLLRPEQSAARTGQCKRTRGQRNDQAGR